MYRKNRFLEFRKQNEERGKVVVNKFQKSHYHRGQMSPFICDVQYNATGYTQGDVILNVTSDSLSELDDYKIVIPIDNIMLINGGFKLRYYANAPFFSEKKLANLICDFESKRRTLFKFDIDKSELYLYRCLGVEHFQDDYFLVKFQQE